MFGLVLLAVLQSTDPLAVVDDEIRPDHDILHYHIAVRIPDAGDAIVGATTVRYAVRAPMGELVLDFDTVFAIDSIVTERGTSADGAFRDDALRISHWGNVGDTVAVTVFYRGTPADGLFIQDNVHGNRSAFADNWPNRARHWFPSEDHPSDKAFASFDVEVPAGWKAIANGAHQGTDTLSSGRTVWRWATEHKVPTYTMVVGGGVMTVTDIGDSRVAHSVWTFPEDSAFAVDTPFRRAEQMVREYAELIGPFPYAKLAHVESSTRFGGMENSSAIFYTERAYASRNMGEGVVAHETAHQWFGDAVTEYDWHHLWLSEGFASYFGPVFFEIVGDTDRFREAMQRAKERYYGSDVVSRPVIDTTETSLFALLNANNYPKGAWILHMLRREIGDDAFVSGVREYYDTYRDSTALTTDLLQIMERHADRPLRWFFEQWLLQPGYPEVMVNWAHDRANGAVTIELTQVQEVAWGTYRLGVPVRVELDGETIDRIAQFDGTRSVTLRVEDVGVEPSGVAVVTDDLLIEVMDVIRIR